MNAQDRMDVELLWSRIRRTGLCAKAMGGVPLGLFLAYHLCDEAVAEGRKTPRTVTRRVLQEFQDYHDPRLQTLGTAPKPPRILRRMHSVPEWSGAIWSTPRARYRVDHGSASLVELGSPAHAKLVATATGQLRQALADAGIPDARSIDIRFETTAYGPAVMDGVQMDLSGMVGGSPQSARRASRQAARFLEVARSDETAAFARAMEEVIRAELTRARLPEMLLGVRCGCVRAPWENENETDPKVVWYAVTLSGLGEDLLPRRWSIVAMPKLDGIGENLKEAVRAERRNRRAVAEGARVDPVVLAALGPDATRDLYDTTAAWTRKKERPGNARMPASRMPERFPRCLDKTALRAGVLTATVTLDKGICWSLGELTLGKTILPEAVLMALPGMRMGDVVEHPWLDQDALIASVKWNGRTYVLKTKMQPVPVPGGNPAHGEQR